MAERYLSNTPAEQKEKFFHLSSAWEIASLLEYDYGHLVYYLYKIPNDQKYVSFDLAKKTGGVREISVPNDGLKFIQRKLNELLNSIYCPKPVTYGFVLGRDIIQNAGKHKKKKWVFNIDIEDFFGAINFGRVRGMFMGRPYFLPEAVARVLAQICVHDNKLPQGAPTSPIISNMLCAKLDSELQDLAWKYRCYCTRYADDITFSTTLPSLPSEIAIVDDYKSVTGVRVGDELRKVIEGNGFSINQKKVRAYSSQIRQEVTGLTVNRFPNVRRRYVKQIRAMLYAWHKYGYANAERVHYEKFSKQYNPDKESPSFRKIVKGKIDFLCQVKGKDSSVCLKFKNQYRFLLARDKGVPSSRYIPSAAKDRPHIYVEGPTDVKILNVAWKKLYDTPCPYEIEDSHPTRENDPNNAGGGAQALRNLLIAVRESTPHITIGLFDNDEAGQKAFSLPKSYSKIDDSDWKVSKGRKSGALLLPIPDGKEGYVDALNLCIEFYFSEDSLNKKNDADVGLEFEFPDDITRRGKVIVRRESSTALESREIKEGKTVFANEIVPSLDKAEFESFKVLFEEIDRLVQFLED